MSVNKIKYFDRSYIFVLKREASLRLHGFGTANSAIFLSDLVKLRRAKPEKDENKGRENVALCPNHLNFVKCMVYYL